MRGNWIRGAFFLALAVGTLGAGTGCTTQGMAVRGQAGRAYIVRGTVFSTDMWNCEANGPKPVCYKVIKKNNPPK